MGSRRKSKLNSARYGLYFTLWILLFFGRCEAGRTDACCATDGAFTEHQQEKSFSLACAAKRLASALFMKVNLLGERGKNLDHYVDEKCDWIGSDPAGSFEPAKSPAGQDGSLATAGAALSGSSTSTTTSSGNISPTLPHPPAPTPTAAPVPIAGSHGATRAPATLPPLAPGVVRPGPPTPTLQTATEVPDTPWPVAVDIAVYARPWHSPAARGTAKPPESEPVGVTPSPLSPTFAPVATTPSTPNPAATLGPSMTRPAAVTAKSVTAMPSPPRPRRRPSPASFDAPESHHPTHDITAGATTLPPDATLPPDLSRRPTAFPLAPAAAPPPTRSPRHTTFTRAPTQGTSAGPLPTVDPGATISPSLAGPSATDIPPPTVEGAEESVPTDDEEWHDSVINLVVDIAGVLAALAVIASAFKYAWSRFWCCCHYLRGSEGVTADEEMAREGATQDPANGGGHVVITGVGNGRQTNSSSRGNENVAGNMFGGSVSRNSQRTGSQTREGNATDIIHDTTDGVGDGTARFRSAGERNGVGSVSDGPATSTVDGEVGNVYTAFVVAAFYELFHLQADRLTPFESESGSFRHTSPARQQPFLEEAQV